MSNPDWADEKAREIVDDIYFAATRAWIQTPQQAWDSQPHKAQIAAALRAERERGRWQADIDADKKHLDEFAAWKARALKAEAAVLKVPEWAYLMCCVFCGAERDEGHAPGCLRAELEARK